MCWEGGLLSSPHVVGQLLRKESRARRAMKVVSSFGGGAALGPGVKGLSGKGPKRGQGSEKSQAQRMNEWWAVSEAEQLGLSGEGLRCLGLGQENGSLLWAKQSSG